MKLKKLLIPIALALCVSLLCFNVSAVTPDAKPSDDKSDQYSYLSEDSIMQYAKQFILQQSKLDSSCPWNTNTTISGSVPLYDLNSISNGYILNLKNSSTDVGYLVIYSFSENPSVNEFSYGGKCYLLSNSHFSYLTGHKIIGLGFQNYGYLDDANQVRDAFTNNVLANSLQKLKSSYKEFYNNSTSSLKMCSQYANYSANTTPKYILNQQKFYPKSQTDFPNGTNGCVPTSVINMFKYWHDCRGKATLINSSDLDSWNVYTKILGYPNDKPFNNDKAYPAAQTYCTHSQIQKYAGSALNENPSFSWINSNIVNGNLVILGCDACLLSDDSGGHNICVVGTQYKSSWPYLIVDNGWGNNGNTSWTWVCWPGDGSNLKGNAFYLRW